MRHPSRSERDRIFTCEVRMICRRGAKGARIIIDFFFFFSLRVFASRPAEMIDRTGSWLEATQKTSPLFAGGLKFCIQKGGGDLF